MSEICVMVRRGGDGKKMMWRGCEIPKWRAGA